MNNSSKVVVLIPHFNNLEGLYKSLASIKESIPVDVLIVDDGSRSKPDVMDLNETFKSISHLNLINLAANQGIENALNVGLKFIKEQNRYEYVARLDSGDLCYHERFSTQVKYMDEHPDVYLSGGKATCQDLQGNTVYEFAPETDSERIKKRMYLQNMFVHPATIFRVSAIDEIGYYPVDCKNAEDYGYFFKFVNRYKTSNLPIPLIIYEINPNGLSMKRRKRQVLSRINVILKNWHYGLYPIMGLAYNLILLAAPIKLLQWVKKKLHA